MASILAILGTVPGHGEEGPRRGIADRCSGGDCASRPVRGVTVYRGLVLDYEVIDGLAVHGGDMVLGTAEEAAAAAPSREAAKREAVSRPVRRDLYSVENSRLWPGGRVPYVIDGGIEGSQLENIHAAIEHWNSKTVIDWFPRTNEQQYVRFLPPPNGARGCYSRLGVGSPTEIGVRGCHLGIVIHEMGHAVGLLHEHERPDWDRFLDEEPVLFDLLGENRSRRFPNRIGDVPELPYPYDYRSIMHYRLGNVTTIPPGIGVSGFIYGSSLSAGDIDGVARLYGKHPGAITVSTNPPGLDVIVDGDRVTAPALFEWLPDSVHTLEAPLEQRQYVFGRWSDGGGRKHMVQAGPDSTWFEANFIRRDPFQSIHSPWNAGSVAISLESPDDRFVYHGSRLELTPVPAEGTPYEFARWDLSGPWWYFLSAHSGLRPEVPTDRLRYISAAFRTPPFYRINSNVEGMLLPFDVNGRRSYAPAAFQPSELPAGTTVWVPRSWRVSDPFGARGRYRFTGWSDGGERSHEIEAPEGGGSLTFYVQREFKLTTHANSGEILVSPESEDGYYPVGSQVQLTAVPEAGRHFLGWEHDVSGTERTQFVIMDRDRRASAKFTRDLPILVPFGEPLQVHSLNGHHYVRVPDGTSQVAVRFESSAPPRNAEFYVTPAFAPSPCQPGSWRPSCSSKFYVTPALLPGDELGSTRLRESDTITINREALSRMWDNARAIDGDSHHLRIQQRHGIGSGKLHVSIQRDWIDRVWPRAFTMVSGVHWPGPVRQTMRIAPVEGVPPQVRYRIVSDRHWLEAVPQEWTGAEGEVEIAVTANGAALEAEAYAGKLEILTVRDGDPPTGGTPTGIEIPVHFVVMPGDDHSNMRHAATEIAAGAAAQGRLEEPGDEDWFEFRTTAANTWVAAYTVSEGDTVGELHAAGGAVVRDDDSGSGGNFRIAANVPAGTHYLRVRGFGTPGYTLRLEAGDDHGNVRGAATEIAAGAAAQGRLEEPGDEDWFEFRTTAANTWVAAYTVSEGDTVGELHAAGGAVVRDDDSGSGGNFRIAANVPAGTHYLRVSGVGTPGYTLRLEAGSDDRDDRDDHGNVRGAATEIAAGAAAQGRLQAVGDEDWFEFRTTAARTYVNAYTVSEGDTVGELHTAGWGVVRDDDSGSGGNFWIATTVPAGTHYLRVSGFGKPDYALVLETGFAMEFVRIPAGSFVMGSPEGEVGRSSNERQHEVRISQGFWMGKREVTQGEWEWVMGENPSVFWDCGARCPVEQVLWDDVQEFIRRLNERESGSGYKYRLPTEAEWEYAARAGTTGARHGELDEVAWYDGNSGERTHPVGQKGANAWGLQDMLGNVGEWTADRYGEYPSGAVTDPQGPGTGSDRVFRGGHVYSSARSVRSGERRHHSPSDLTSLVGFRLVRTGGDDRTRGDDHGDTSDVATEIAEGAAAQGRLEVPGDEDWFEFRTTAANTRVTAYTDSEGDTVGELHAAGGAVVRDDDSGSGGNFRIAANVPAGTHYVRVSGVGTPSYTLRLEAGSDDRDDHGDTRGAATEIAVGATAQGRLEVLGDEDWFEFRTTAASTWVTAYTDSEGDTVGELHAAGGAVVRDDDSGSGGNFRIAANVPAGTHYLRVSGRSGTYALKVEAGFPMESMEFVRIPAGSFVMGSPEDEEGRRSDERQHEVRISQGFWMGKYEVTQEEWNAVMGANPSSFKGCGSRCPVETVSWNDIQEFIRRLNELASGSGSVYRLPTEAEWEYAARAGTTGPRYGELDEIAWHSGNSGRMHPVGQKGANAWGLHDMLGNVWEWTADWSGEYPSGAVTDPQGPETGSIRVDRGGGWVDDARYVRSASRGPSSAGGRNSFIGFRLVRTE